MSARGKDEAEVQRLMKEQNKAAKEKQRLKKLRKTNPTAAESEVAALDPPVHNIEDVQEPPRQDEVNSAPSRSLKRLRDEADSDPITEVLPLPDAISQSAPPPFQLFGRDMINLVKLSEDQSTSMCVGAKEAGKNALAYISSALVWAGAQYAQTVNLEKDLEKAAKDLQVANEDLEAAEERAREAERKEKVLADKYKELKNKLSSRDKELEEAVRAKLAAQVEWTRYGMKQKLLKAKEVGIDYTQLLFDDEPDPIEPVSEDEGSNTEKSGEN